MKKNFSNNVLKNKHCIECGLCKIACPCGAIQYKKNFYGEKYPQIDSAKCTNCGLCKNICPNLFEKLRDNSDKIQKSDYPRAYGLKNGSYYLAWNKNYNERLKSASGGVITFLANHLLKTGKIDAVIHTERLFSQKGQPFYRASITKKPQELINKAGSSYQPIDFSETLENLEAGKTYFITGTPCVISGIKKLAQTQKFKNIKLITCALICSHNTNAQFLDYLSDSLKIPQNEPYAIDIRNKDFIPNANEFNNHFYTKNSSLLKINRFKSGWTKLWRSYYFSKDACLYCNDFWGTDADVSVKDAWGKWSDDPFGKSIVIFRDKNLEEIFRNSEIGYKALDYEEMKDHQANTTDFKLCESYNRLNLPYNAPENVKNGFYKYTTISKSSKLFYKLFGQKITSILMPIIEKRIELKEQALLLNEQKRRAKEKTIYVAGGHGYGNAGDEAQCSETLSILKKRYPNYEIINLTPNVEYSSSLHNCKHKLASRVVFFRQFHENYFNYQSNKEKFNFWKIFLITYLSALFIKLNIKPLFLNNEQIEFLYDIKNAQLFYFSGGGYLTGSTNTRFWDGMLLCKLCAIFNVPTVMSGQTLGIWGNKFNRFIAKWGLKDVKIITVRDEKSSFESLKEIGIKSSNVFATHDDALFCAQSNIRQIPSENYSVINFHYWGMQENDKYQIIEKLHQIITHMLEKNDQDLYFIPLVPTDEIAYNDYIKKYPSSRFRCFKYDYDFKKIKRAIADSKFCLTMKHHPLIFAMGSNVPTISLIFSKYYVHKNIGALQQYNMEKYSINLEEDDSCAKFISMYNDINNNYAEIQNIIRNRKSQLSQRKEHFLKLVDELLD